VYSPDEPSPVVLIITSSAAMNLSNELPSLNLEWKMNQLELVKLRPIEAGLDVIHHTATAWSPSMEEASKYHHSMELALTRSVCGPSKGPSRWVSMKLVSPVTGWGGMILVLGLKWVGGEGPTKALADESPHKSLRSREDFMLDGKAVES
jgi:hypothetical protein